MATDDSLPSFPFPPGGLLAPPEEYARRRAECPFGKVRLPSGDSAILLVRHADIAAAVAEPRLSRNHVLPGAPQRSGEPNFLYDPTLLINQENVTHGRIHQVTTQALNNQRVTGYLPLIEDSAAGLAAAMAAAGPAADLVEAFTDRLPLEVIGRLLGIPARDSPRIRRWSAAYTQSTPAGPAERAAMVAEFTDYVRAFTANPARIPAAPLLQDLAFAPAADSRLSRDELASIVKLLLSAGAEAPAAVLGRSLLYLLLDQGKSWRLLVRDRSLSAPVGTELLRLVHAGNAAALRTAVADVKLPSGVVPAGQAVLLAWISALHDPEVYADPGSMRLDRDAPKNIGFGGGRHYCPGVGLAKAVLTIGLATLAERFPRLRLAIGESDVPLAEREIGTVVRSLPVSW